MAIAFVPIGIAVLKALWAFFLTRWVAELTRKDPKIDPIQFRTRKDADAPHPVIYGQAKVGTIAHDYLVDESSSFDSILYMPLTICHGSRDGFGIAEIGDVFFDGARGITSNEQFVHPYSARTVDFQKQLGTLTQNLGAVDMTGLVGPTGGHAVTKCLADFASWDANDKGAAVAALLLRLRSFLRDVLRGSENERKKVFLSGPPHVSCVVKGNFVEDTRDEVSGTNITFADADPDTITRVDGDFTTEGWTAKDRVAVTGSSEGANNTSWTVAGVAAKVLTLHADDALTAAGPEAGVTLKRWAHPDNGGDNPAMCIRDYLLSTVYGAGLASSMIDETSFETVADLCDTSPAPLTDNMFRLNGVLDTGRKVKENLAAMLGTCRANPVWQDGKFGIFVRTTKAPTGDLELTDANIVGDWAFRNAGQLEKFNIGRAAYLEPGGDTDMFRRREAQWPAAGAANTYLTDDDSFANWIEIELPFTTSFEQAQHTVQTALRESRQGITCEVTCTEAALRLVVGDVVNVTHETPGWEDKAFWVMSVGIIGNGQIRLGLMEYEATCYTISNITSLPTEPDTQLGDLWSVPEVGGVYLDSGTLEDRVRVSWVEADYNFVAYYEVQAMHDSSTGGDGVWRTFARVRGREGSDLEAWISGARHEQAWYARVRIVNTVGASGDWVTSALHAVNTHPSSDITAQLDAVAEGVEVNVTDYETAAIVHVYARENDGAAGLNPLETPQYHVTALFPGDGPFLIPAADGQFIRALLVPYNIFGERGIDSGVLEQESGAAGAGPTGWPTDIVAADKDYESVDLTWTCADAGSQTRLYVDGVLFSTLAATVALDTVDGLQSDTEYVFELRHLENGIFNRPEGTGTVENIDKLTISTSKGTLGAPTSLATQTIDPAKVKLTWLAGDPTVAGVYYEVWRDADDVWPGGAELIKTTDPGVLQYTHEDWDECGVTWYYKVLAKHPLWTDSALCASVAGTYGADASVDYAEGMYWDDGEGPGDETHTIAWELTAADNALHHICIHRSTNGAAYVEITDDLAVDDMGDGDDPWGRPSITYHGMSDANTYKYKVKLELDGGDVLVDEYEITSMEPKPE